MTDQRPPKPTPKIGLTRIVCAFFYSLSGLKQALKHETAFRQEIYLFIIFFVLLFFLPLPPAIKMILFMCNSLVLITELLNSSIESVVDKASPEYHELAKHAKDIASGAVLISIVSAGLVWLYALSLMIFPIWFS